MDVRTGRGGHHRAPRWRWFVLEPARTSTRARNVSGGARCSSVPPTRRHGSGSEGRALPSLTDDRAQRRTPLGPRRCPSGVRRARPFAHQRQPNRDLILARSRPMAATEPGAQQYSRARSSSKNTLERIVRSGSSSNQRSALVRCPTRRRHVPFHLSSALAHRGPGTRLRATGSRAGHAASTFPGGTGTGSPSARCGAIPDASSSARCSVRCPARGRAPADRRAYRSVGLHESVRLALDAAWPAVHVHPG